MRTLLILITCLSLLFQPVASAHVAQKKCPMMQDSALQMQMMSSIVQADASDEHDCCNDAETAAKTEQLCKTDMPCGSASAYVVPSLNVGIFFVPMVTPESVSKTLISTFDPAGIWRPPSFS